MLPGYKGFKKTSDDKDKAVLSHESGHQITIVKKGLSKPLKKQLEALPLHQTDPQAPIGQDAPVNSLSDAAQQMYTPDLPPARQEAPIVNPIGAGNGLPEPQPQAPTPEAAQTPMEAITGYQEGENAINLGQAADSQKAEAGLAAINQKIASEEMLRNAHQATQQDILQHINATTQDIHDGYINPKQYVENMGAPKKIATAIGLILGGISAGRSGGQNPAMAFLENQINRDIDSQKANMNKKSTLLGAYQQQYKDDVTGEAVARATSANVYADQINKAALQTGDLQARQRALMASSEFKRSYIPLVNAAANRQLVQKVTQNPQAAAQVDPASLVPYLTDPGTLKPLSPEMQTNIAKEIGDAQNMSQNESNILGAFDRAKSENSIAGRAGRLGFEPPSSKEFKALVDPFFHDINGRYNEQEAAHVYRLLPSPGSRTDTDAANRQALQAWVEHKKAAPLAKSFGLDLSRFQSTKGPQSPTKTVNGQKVIRGQ